MHMTHSKEHGHKHDHHDHEHTHEHEHGHDSLDEVGNLAGKILTVRAISGLSGDIMLAGLARMLNATQANLDTLLATIKLPSLKGSISLEERSINGVAGWGVKVSLPHEHAHRTLSDIIAILDASGLTPKAASLARKTFEILAAAEGAVHGMEPATVTFHEVGALDSILDICIVCALFDQLQPDHFICSPLPLADGSIHCAHGWITSPAPAVLRMLEGIPVCSFAGKGETLTPTAIALLKSCGASFGLWPTMKIERQALVYGSKVFEGAPNGTIWAYGAS